MTKQELIDKIMGFDADNFAAVMVVCGSIDGETVTSFSIIDGASDELITVAAIEGVTNPNGFAQVIKGASDIIKGKEKEERDAAKAEKAARKEKALKGLLG